MARTRRACAALAALCCAALGAAAAAATPQASPPPPGAGGDGGFSADSLLLFAGQIDVTYTCLVLTAADDGNSDTLRTALGDPNCVAIKLAAGLTVSVTEPLLVRRSVRLECDYAAAALVPFVPPVRVLDSLGAPRAGAPPAVAPQNATLPGALSDACVLDGSSTSQIIVLPSSAPAGIRLNITDVVFRNGVATTSGGAIAALSSRAFLVLDHVTFDSNSALLDGGAIVVTSGTALVALGCLFVENEAMGSGAAIAATNSEVALEHCSFERNTCDSGDGTVQTRNTNLQIHYTLFLNNVGGALSIGTQLTPQQAVIIAFTQFMHNTIAASEAAGVNQDGGAINALGQSNTGGARLDITLWHVQFEGNVAGRYGGALATRSGVSVSARACSFFGNTDSCAGAAGGRGGAAYLNIGADASGAGCSDTLTVDDDATPCATWALDALARQSTGRGWGPAPSGTCVPLAPAALGPFCCHPSLAAPLGCPWPPVVFDLPALMCP